MYADIMLLRISALPLNHDFHEEEKLGQNCCQSHYHLLLGVILVQLTVAQSGQPSVDTFSLACTNQIVRAYTDQHHSRFLANHLNSLVVERTRFMLEKSTSFPILERSSFQYRFMKITLLSAKLHACFMEIGLTAIIAFWKQQKSLWLIGFSQQRF